jgi:hypothetical protein
MSLFPYFFGSLPGFFKVADYEKDVNSKGQLERYLSIFQTEAETYKEDITRFDSLTQPTGVPLQYLSFLSALLGNPPNTFNNNSVFRNILRVLPWVLFSRGTEGAAVSFFKILGIDFALEQLPVSEEAKYDNDNHFDSTSLFDSSKAYCRYYKAILTDTENLIPVLGEDPVPDWALLNLTRIFEYLLPINCFISEVIYNDLLILDPVIIIRKYSSSNLDLRISFTSIIRKV